MTPPEPIWAVSNKKTNYGYYVDYILKLDGVLTDTYGTLTDGIGNTWNLVNYDDGMSNYLTPGFFVGSGNLVYLGCYVNRDLYTYYDSTWHKSGGTSDPVVVSLIVGLYPSLGIDTALLAAFANGSVQL